MNKVTLSPSDRQQLNKMMKSSDYVDNTVMIREQKHSFLIEKDIEKILEIQETAPEKINDPNAALELCKKEAFFLYSHYSEIFHRLIKCEINMIIMKQFIHVLRMIENNEINQVEGSVMVGQILKEMYLDSAIRRGEKSEEMNEPPERETGKDISWKTFKTNKRMNDIKE